MYEYYEYYVYKAVWGHNPKFCGRWNLNTSGSFYVYTYILNDVLGNNHNINFDTYLIILVKLFYTIYVFNYFTLN